MKNESISWINFEYKGKKVTAEFRSTQGGVELCTLKTEVEVRNMEFAASSPLSKAAWAAYKATVERAELGTDVKLPPGAPPGSTPIGRGRYITPPVPPSGPDLNSIKFSPGGPKSDHIGSNDKESK